MEEQGDRSRALLEGANKRMKMKRLCRIHYITMKLGTACHVKLDLDPPRSSASCFVDGMTQTRIPDRFIIRSVIPFHPIPYIMLRPDLV